MNNNHLAIIGIAETRLTGTRKQRLKSGEPIIWTGRQDNNHQKGVALIIASKYGNTLFQWKPIGVRLQYETLYKTHQTLHVI